MLWENYDLYFMNANNWPELPIVLEENKTITIPQMPICYVTAPARY